MRSTDRGELNYPRNTMLAGNVAIWWVPWVYWVVIRYGR